jgi:hypothetical protein
MKKLMIIAGFAISSLLMSCSIFIRTPHHAAGATIGSTQPVHPADTKKAGGNEFFKSTYIKI